MRVMIDGVAFNRGPRAVADRWARLLRVLAREPDLHVDLLDRGGAPEIAATDRIDVPSYRGEYTPADSQLLQRVASHHGADVFVSTGWTTPLTTPSVVVVFAAALPPHADLAVRDAAELALALRHASRVVCAGELAHTALQARLSEAEMASLSPTDTVQRDEQLAAVLCSALRTAVAGAPAAAGFYARWSALRELQAAVDG